MSDLGAVAQAISSSSPERLADLLALSGITAGGVKRDLLEAAAQLGSEPAVRHRLSYASETTARALRARLTDPGAPAEPPEQALELLLVAGDAADWRPLEVAQPPLLAHRFDTHRPRGAHPVEPGDPNPALVMATDLIHELAAAPIRLLASGNLPGGEVKRLEERYGVEAARLQALVAILRSGRLLATQARPDGHDLLGPTRAADAWLDGTPAAQWRGLEQAARLGADRMWSTVFAPGPAPEAGDVRELIDARLPLLGPRRGGGQALAQQAVLLGYADEHGTLTQLYRDSVLAGRPLTDDDPRLARTIEQIYVLEDRTIVAPGRLTSRAERFVRSLATAEQVGLATSYRATPATLARAYAQGITPEHARAGLERLSATPIPQSLAYLIDEVGQRYDRIRVREHPRGVGAVITCTDPDERTVLLRDTQLAMLGLAPIADDAVSGASLQTRLDVESTLAALHHARYPAVAADAAGAILATRRETYLPDPPPLVSPLLEAARTILASASVDLGATGADLEHRLLLALRQKAWCEVTVEVPDQGKRTFTILPKDLKNGRLRGKDRTVDVERTLPVALISDVRLAE